MIYIISDEEFDNISDVNGYYSSCMLKNYKCRYLGLGLGENIFVYWSHGPANVRFGI